MSSSARHALTEPELDRLWSLFARLRERVGDPDGQPIDLGPLSIGERALFALMAVAAPPTTGLHGGFRDTPEHGDWRTQLGGNAPLLVDRRTGALHVLGTAEPTQAYIDRYRATGDPHRGVRSC